jgi:hypothetical protein
MSLALDVQVGREPGLPGGVLRFGMARSSTGI